MVLIKIKIFSPSFFSYYVSFFFAFFLNQVILSSLHGFENGRMPMETKEALRKRRSCRHFLNKQIAKTDLQQIIWAGNTAPVGMGKYQNIHLTVVQNTEMLARLSSECAETWNGQRFDPRYGAPTLILVSAVLEKEPTAYANVACVVENMHLMATDLGLGSIYLWGFIKYLKQNEKLKCDLSIPSEFEPLSALAVGYAAKPMKEHDSKKLKIGINFID